MIAAAAIPIVANAARSHAASSGVQTITVSEDIPHNSVLAIVDPSNRSTDPSLAFPGDYIIEKAPLRNAAGNRVGTVEGVLTFVTGSKNFHSDLMNRRIWILHNGSLFLEGMNSPSLGDYDIVTGGTGAYAGAHGYVTSPPKGDLETAHLLP